jgi:hypothetical protein
MMGGRAFIVWGGHLCTGLQTDLRCQTLESSIQYSRCCSLLSRKGADLKSTNNKGQTPVSRNEICAGSSNRLDSGFLGLLRLGWIAPMEVFHQILKSLDSPPSALYQSRSRPSPFHLTLYWSCSPFPNNRESRVSSTSYSSSSSTTIGCGGSFADHFYLLRTAELCEYF